MTFKPASDNTGLLREESSSFGGFFCTAHSKRKRSQEAESYIRELEALKKEFIEIYQLVQVGIYRDLHLDLKDRKSSSTSGLFPNYNIAYSYQDKVVKPFQEATRKLDNFIIKMENNKLNSPAVLSSALDFVKNAANTGTLKDLLYFSHYQSIRQSKLEGYQTELTNQRDTLKDEYSKIEKSYSLRKKEHHDSLLFAGIMSLFIVGLPFFAFELILFAMDAIGTEIELRCKNNKIKFLDERLESGRCPYDDGINNLIESNEKDQFLQLLHETARSRYHPDLEIVDQLLGAESCSP